MRWREWEGKPKIEERIYIETTCRLAYTEDTQAHINCYISHNNPRFFSMISFLYTTHIETRSTVCYTYILWIYLLTDNDSCCCTR